MYTDLIEKLSNVKDENDITSELLGQLLASFINSSTKLLEIEEPDLDYQETIIISRANVLRIYDQALYSAKINDVDF